MSLSDKDMSRLCEVIMSLIYERGFKSTTMDLVASRLHISKRTLYEIFGDKDGMLAAALDYISEERKKDFTQIVNDSPNILVAMIRIFKYQIANTEKLNVDFFRDMDRLYKKVRPQYEEQRLAHEQEMVEAFEMGVAQGVFRTDVNYIVLTRMLQVQIEALKRNEEFIPNGISLSEIFESIWMTLLRGIVTPKGMKIIEDIIK